MTAHLSEVLPSEHVWVADAIRDDEERCCETQVIENGKGPAVVSREAVIEGDHNWFVWQRRIVIDPPPKLVERDARKSCRREEFHLRAELPAQHNIPVLRQARQQVDL